MNYESLPLLIVGAFVVLLVSLFAGVWLFMRMTDPLDVLDSEIRETASASVIQRQSLHRVEGLNG